jgi:hypothetical protein
MRRWEGIEKLEDVAQVCHTSSDLRKGRFENLQRMSKVSAREENDREQARQVLVTLELEIRFLRTIDSSVRMGTK